LLNWKKTLYFFFIIIGLFVPTMTLAANTFTLSVPAGTEVTMGDAEAIIPVTITNGAASAQDIKGITFTIDTASYNFSSSTIAPAGWCVLGTPTTGSVTFGLLQGSGACSSGNNGSQIVPGGSLTFNIKALPLAAAADVAGDSFLDVTVGGFTRGALPAWTRRALMSELIATPSSTGTGSAITLQMQVINRSTVAQSLITTSPAPPSFSSAIVTNTAGTYWGSNTLGAALNATSATITLVSTSEFPTTGTIKIDSEEVCYTGKTAATLTGATRGCNATTAAAHSSGAVVYSLTPFTLASGASGTMTWLYGADLAGTVYFSARAQNSGGTSSSVLVNSNTVVIGSFTAAMSVAPSSVISSQTITVSMTVTNNGTSALVNVVPNALTQCAGGATETLVTGPSPASISSIAGGSSGTFTWTYTIAGTMGQTYCLSGTASANGPVTTNTALSNSGTVSSYSVSVSPGVIASASTNTAITWSVFNGSGYTIKEVSVATPAAGGDWTCSSVTAPAGWSGACAATVIFASSGAANDIPANGTKNFTITFSTTETVTTDKTVSFPVTLTARGGAGSSNTVASSVIVSAYALTLAHSPIGPIDADGTSLYTMTATLTSGGAPVSGKTITFTTTNGSLTASTAVTGATGVATTSLVSPVSAVNTSATVTAEYQNASSTDTVSFTGYVLPNISYWGGLTPVPPAPVTCGAARSFTLTLKNISAIAMTLTSASYFAFNDSSSGGCSVYKAFLNATDIGSIAASAVKTVTFGSPTSVGAGGGVTVATSFVVGTYSPAANAAPPSESGLFLTDGGGVNDQYRTVTDTVSVSGSCSAVKINVIEWWEFR